MHSTDIYKPEACALYLHTTSMTTKYRESSNLNLNFTLSSVVSTQYSVHSPPASWCRTRIQRSNPRRRGSPGTISIKFSLNVTADSQGTKLRRKIAENFSRLSTK